MLKKLIIALISLCIFSQNIAMEHISNVKKDILADGTYFCGHTSDGDIVSCTQYNTGEISCQILYPKKKKSEDSLLPKEQLLILFKRLSHIYEEEQKKSSSGKESKDKAKLKEIFDTCTQLRLSEYCLNIEKSECEGNIIFTAKSKFNNTQLVCTKNTSYITSICPWEMPEDVGPAIYYFNSLSKMYENEQKSKKNFIDEMD